MMFLRIFFQSFEEKSVSLSDACALHCKQERQKTMTEVLAAQSPKSTTSVKKKKEKSAFEKLPYDIQEEIECLYEFVDEVKQHFEVIDKIGEGTFSSVFLARLKYYPDIDQLFALKHIIPTSHPSRIESELRCLLNMGGRDNVMGVELCIRSKDHVVIVMPYFPHERFQDYILKMKFSEVRDYIENLLLALRRVHQFDIIHRDVKPSNFLYDRKTKKYALVDFGLAHEAPVKKKASTEMTDDKREKKVLTPSQDTSNQMKAATPEYPHPKASQDSEEKRKRYATPTPSLSQSVFTKRMKSPRRMLLAKRALLVKEKEDPILSERRSPNQHRYKPAACQCFGKPQICSLCSSRCNQVAPRAGTPGFRSPEVLMKCPDQSTAVDIWSAGVIFLSLLSGRYPFFRANDDMTALAQIISLFGSEAVKDAALNCGKSVTCGPSQGKADFRALCNKLRAAPVSKNQLSKKYCKESEEAEKTWRNVPDSAYHLLSRLLDLNPYTRITADEALKHPFFTEVLGSETCIKS